MKRTLLVAVLLVILVGAWGSLSLAGDVGYRFRVTEQDVAFKSIGPPSSSVVAADALIARPVGLALTIAGTAVYVVTLPMSLGSGSTEEAGWGLVGRPAGYTFVRPLGRSEPKYEERGIFRP